MPSIDLLSLFVAPLDRLGLSYMATGAVAAIIYGDPRLTNDVDLVVELTDGDAERLSEKHVRDVRAMLRVLGDSLDRPALLERLERLGLRELWAGVERADDSRP